MTQALRASVTVANGRMSESVRHAGLRTGPPERMVVA